SHTTYWQETFRPYIASPMRDMVQWYAAHDALARLHDTAKTAWHWNKFTQEGQQFPVPEKALLDLRSDEFGEPKPLCKNEDRNRQLEAVPLRSGLSPDDAVRQRHEDILAAQRYLDTLPENPETMAGVLNLAFGEVTFEQIVRSNETTGQLPLLPPV